MMKICIFDFDKTIYNGDSSLDFYFFCLKKNKKLIKYLPKQIIGIFLFLIGIKNKEYCKTNFFSFLNGIDNINEYVNLFWRENIKKIKSFYFEKKRQNCIIISASPFFLLNPICKKLNIETLLATNIDRKTGIIKGNNCSGKEKVARLYKKYNNVIIDEFYTDSISDEPLIKISTKAYIVIGQKVINYQVYKKRICYKIKKIFFNKQFIAFIFVGCLNTLNGIFLSFVFSMFLNEILAFLVGYSCSLIVSYFLNSIITFKDYNFSAKKLFKFYLSYIPNFLIQIICVFVILNVLHLYKLFAYIISAIIGIPATFILIKMYTFNKKG